MSDGSGRPLRFILTAGGRSDYIKALELLEGIPYQVLLADKGYDADYIVEAGEEKGAEVVIPPRSNRNISRSYSKPLYKERNLIERMFSKLKHFRRIATRYDKLAERFLSWVFIGASCLWLR